MESHIRSGKCSRSWNGLRQINIFRQGERIEQVEEAGEAEEGEVVEVVGVAEVVVEVQGGGPKSLGMKPSGLNQSLQRDFEMVFQPEGIALAAVPTARAHMMIHVILKILLSSPENLMGEDGIHFLMWNELQWRLLYCWRGSDYK